MAASLTTTVSRWLGNGTQAAMSLEETQTFFETYRDAFNRLDGDAVADLWNDRSAITSAGKDGTATLAWWSEDAPMRANHHALCDGYRRAGYDHADFAIEQHLPLGADHAFAHLHWQLWRQDGTLLQQFHTGYQLIRTAAGVRVLLVVAHQEKVHTMLRLDDTNSDAGNDAGLH